MGRRTSATAAVAVAGVLAAVALVVLASRGTPADRTAAAYDTPVDVRTVLYGVAAGALVVGAVIAVWALWPDGSGPPPVRPKRRWLPQIVIAVVLLLMAWGAANRNADESTRRGEATKSPPSPTTTTIRHDDDRPPRDRADPRVSLAIGAALLLLVGGGLALRRASGRDAGGDPDQDGTDTDAADRLPLLSPSLLADLAAGDLDAAIRVVLDEPDPRRAVRLAYAILDAVLADTPAARPAAATPNEWLRHLSAVHRDDPDLGAAAGRLTRRYERARFSVRPCTADDRTGAADDLRPLTRLLARA